MVKPGRTQQQVTEAVAADFAKLAEGMWKRGVPADKAAHFLMKLMFCMFAEDIDLLPKKLFLETVKASKDDPKRCSKLLADLFDKMAHGGDFGREEIARFNGGLFADADVVELTSFEIQQLVFAANNDWSNVEPSIFGTLFERTLNPDKRSQLGAHYTSRADIETLLNPVMMDPLRREWDEVRAKADKLFEKAKGSKSNSKPRRDFEKCVNDFLYRLDHVTVLDPACGSGNFLYVAIHLLLTLEKEVIAYANAHGMVVLIPGVRPTQLRGIEINPTAQQLAQVVIWIGFLQWMKFNGFVQASDPVLDPMETIENRDAILDLSDPANPKEAEWPDAEFIVGNPPFLGGKLLRTNLGDAYVDAMFEVWGERVRPEADLVVYWFEKARAMIEFGRVKRAGLLATQGIRGGANRDALIRIKDSGDIFFAISDRNWFLDGATVHVSMIGFDDGSEPDKNADGNKITSIGPDLSSGLSIHTARQLEENAGKSFMGITPAGQFDTEFASGVMLLHSVNPNRNATSDVVRPYVNGKDLNQRPRHQWTIDFGTDATQEYAALYEAAFELVAKHVRPEREKNNREAYRIKWWLYAEARRGMRMACGSFDRYIGTCMVAKHRVFSWIPTVCLPANVVIAFAFDDDYSFGLLHSRPHVLWAFRQGTQLREKESGDRYTPTTCFETFPFPDPTAKQREAIAAAAKELDTLRNNWLNPPEWTRTEVLEFPGSAEGPWKRYVHDPDKNGIGTVKYPRVVAKDAESAAKLRKRTLTNLYNERPTWLANIHKRLDEAVFAAYGWNADLSDDELLAKLLALNLERAPR